MQSEAEWDPAKEQANFRKHGVRFAQALTALEDDNALTIEDDFPDERRFITLGMDETQRLLVVVYTYCGKVVRIISARRATLAERAAYLRGDR
jgi:uncharacterized DUF497 family protein